ncbi:hydroxymethylbilane synthase [candidate division KSB1 bacterium]
MTGACRIGTRSSRLARYQTDRVAEMLKTTVPDIDIEIIPIATTGDRITDIPLNQIGSQGLFTKELEHALLDNLIDIAVHSMKDLESTLPGGLTIGAVPERDDARDVIISELHSSVEELPQGSTVFTGSLRRRAQLMAARNDLIINDIRGNVETRIKKFHESGAQALIMAAAGLRRLGLGDEIAGFIPVETILPAVGQGALAVEIRNDDNEAAELCRLINDEKRYAVAAAERRFLQVLQGGCRVPIGGYGMLNDGTLELTGMVASLNGEDVVRKKTAGNPDDAEELGEKLAETILQAGGREIIDSFPDGSI